MEHIFELEGFTQEMDGCFATCNYRCANDCVGACVDRCRGNCFEVYCGGGCAHVGK